TNAGNNSSQIGYVKGHHTDINITSFWWGENEWMPAHELGHVLGFYHEHQRWDRDQYITVHFENIKPGRENDYLIVAATNWPVTTLPYDYKSIMHYRVCWASACEDFCRDAEGHSPCAVISPLDSQYDAVIGQWTDNHISELDAERARRMYGVADKR
ncbi:MAG TPA: M12 family metallopeptidase, partial [Verrucomicrobiae bacterium]